MCVSWGVRDPRDVRGAFLGVSEALHEVSEVFRGRPRSVSRVPQFQRVSWGFSSITRVLQGVSGGFMSAPLHSRKF